MAVGQVQFSAIETLTEVAPEAWNALDDSGDPFLRHAFLSGLEQHDCLSPQGWYPVHILATSDDELIAALPLYLKDNSYGEFVFDWSWADAYQRAGGKYYPKLVSAIPFTPATGNRVLIKKGWESAELVKALISAVGQLMDANEASSFHCLFPTEAQSQALEEASLLTRRACQYHWFNRNYESFDAYLAELKSKRRKQIRKERRDANSAGLTIETLYGDDIKEEHWHVFHQFYCSTFYRKWGEPRLTEAFFNYLSAAMPDAPLLVLAANDGEYIAGSFCMRGDTTLFGRHWGCSEHFNHLHFELCYYQNIEFCIRENLQRFDAGAQGEHKIMRGFEPVTTWSNHLIRDPGFGRAIKDFLDRETPMIEQYIGDLASHSAYRQAE